MRGALGRMKGRIESHEGRIGSHEGRIGSHEGRIGSHGVHPAARHSPSHDVVSVEFSSTNIPPLIESHEGRMRGAWGASAYFQNTNSRKNSKIFCSKVLVPMAVGFSIDLPKIAYSLDISIKYSV